MLRRYIKKIGRSQIGFTLIELLVVVAILGVLAAIVIPNIARFIGYGRSGVGDTELREVQNAVVAFMADKPVIDRIPQTPTPRVGVVSGTPGTDIGVTDSNGTERHLTDYIVGGIIKCLGEYEIDEYGGVTQISYPQQ
jgi:type IV pilus assembly protein PilA